MYYDGSSSGTRHAGNTDDPGIQTEILLEPGEFIVTVTGRSVSSHGWVGHLAFASNEGRSQPSIQLEPTSHMYYRQDMGPFWHGQRR